jgi:hypothetical protein
LCSPRSVGICSEAGSWLCGRRRSACRSAAFQAFCGPLSWHELTSVHCHMNVLAMLEVCKRWDCRYRNGECGENSA